MKLERYEVGDRIVERGVNGPRWFGIIIEIDSPYRRSYNDRHSKVYWIPLADDVRDHNSAYRIGEYDNSKFLNCYRKLS